MDRDTLEWLVWFQSAFLHRFHGRVASFGRYTTYSTGDVYECSWEPDGDDHMLRLTNTVTGATAGVRVYDTATVDNPAPRLEDLVKVWRLIRHPSRNGFVSTIPEV